MDGLDFGVGDLNVGGGFTPPPDFQVPNFSADFNIGNLAGASNIGAMKDPFADLSGMTGGPAPGTTPTPGKSTFQTISDYAKTAAPILGLGTTAAQIPLQLAQLSQSGRAEKAMEGAVATERAAAAPAIAAENALLPAGTDALLTGNLPPELEAQVNEQVNAWKQQQLQTLTANGMDPATAQAMIADQETQLRNDLTIKAAESLLGGGMSAGGLATSAASGGGTLAAGAASANPLQAANQALARLTASS